MAGMMSGKALQSGAPANGMMSGAQMAQFAPEDDDPNEDDLKMIEQDLSTVSEMAAETGFDVAKALQEQDFQGLLEAAKNSPGGGTDGGIRAIEMLSSRLGLGSQWGVDYSEPFNPDGSTEFVFPSEQGQTPWGPPARPNMRPGGIGSR